MVSSLEEEWARAGWCGRQGRMKDCELIHHIFFVNCSRWMWMPSQGWQVIQAVTPHHPPAPGLLCNLCQQPPQKVWFKTHQKSFLQWVIQNQRSIFFSAPIVRATTLVRRASAPRRRGRSKRWCPEEWRNVRRRRWGSQSGWRTMIVRRRRRCPWWTNLQWHLSLHCPHKIFLSML